MRCSLTCFFTVMSAGRGRPRKGAPGILDVAARAGVSPATVSRFFNTPKLLRTGTRERVSQAATDLGYRKGSMVDNLPRGFTGTIGLVVPTFDNSIFAEMIDAFAARLRDLDLTLLIAAHDYDLSGEIGIVRSLLERRIDGVALVGLEHDPVAMRMLKMRDVPVLSLWNYRANSEIPCVGGDNFAAGEMVAQALLSHGHRDIAWLFPAQKGNDRASDRLLGVKAALADAGVEVPHKWQLNCPYDLTSAKERAIKVLAKKDKPTALLCGNDIIAHGVIYAAQALGIRIPHDVSVAGIGDFQGSASIEPGLSTVRLPARRIGVEAADLISKASFGLWEAQPRKLMPHHWIERGTIAHPDA